LQTSHWGGKRKVVKSTLRKAESSEEYIAESGKWSR